MKVSAALTMTVSRQPPIKRRDGAQQRAADEADRAHDQDDEAGAPAGHHHAREQIAAEMIGPQRMGQPTACAWRASRSMASGSCGCHIPPSEQQAGEQAARRRGAFHACLGSSRRMANCRMAFISSIQGRRPSHRREHVVVAHRDALHQELADARQAEQHFQRGGGADDPARFRADGGDQRVEGAACGNDARAPGGARPLASAVRKCGRLACSSMSLR
jgi:hypothetical protein